MRYLIDHELRLAFAHPVREHHCELRIAPADTPTQRVHALAIATEPASELGTYVDYFGNRVHYCSVLGRHDQLVVRVHAEVETLLSNPFDYPLLPAAQEREWLEARLREEPRLWDYVLHRSELTPHLERLALDGDAITWPAYEPHDRLHEAVARAGEWAAATLAVDPDEVDPHARLADALTAGTGSAVDVVHLLVAVIRHWGVPARVVLGYRDPELAEAEEDDEPPAPGLHPWVDVLLPGAGWRGFDPAAALVVNDAYVTVGVGRDAADAVLHRSSCKGEDTPAREIALVVRRGGAQ